MKLIVGASAGGHANDLDTLLSRAGALWPVQPEAYVTTAAVRKAEIEARGLRVHLLSEADRRTPWRGLRAVWQARRVIREERPDVVITTGAMPMVFLSAWARLAGAKVVWVDCISQTEVLSVSGRIAKRFVDLTLTQWPEVAARTRGVEYAGEVM